MPSPESWSCNQVQIPREGKVAGGDFGSCSGSVEGTSAAGFEASSSLQGFRTSSAGFDASSSLAEDSSEDSSEDGSSFIGFGISEMVSRLNDMISSQYEFPPNVELTAPPTQRAARPCAPPCWSSPRPCCCKSRPGQLRLVVPSSFPCTSVPCPASSSCQ